MSKSNPNDKILVVEDNKTIAQSLAEIIASFGFRCEIAADGQAAMGLLKDNTYFLMITEPRLPKVSGFKLLKYVSENLSAMLVAVLSTDNTPDSRGIIVRSRADFYIAKPIKATNVRDVLLTAKDTRDRQQSSFNKQLS